MHPRPFPAFGVHADCICCSVCTDVAPGHFRLETERAEVIRQPDDAASLALCREARDACPVEAIVESGPAHS